MAERLAEGGELAVDELKRKARRRLVGAIVLVLAAVIVVPMLLEDEPRPLGDDVAVQIPARDESKFVNRLTGAVPEAKAPTAPAAPPVVAATTPRAPALVAPAVPAAPGMTKSLAEAEQRVLAPTAKAAPKGASTPGAVEPKREPEAKSAIEAKPTAAPASPTPSAPAASEFVVQLAAYADDKGANALANKLKRVNYAAYVEPVNTSRGTLWRVRVGGYASRADADAARAKLKDEGYSGIVAPAK